MEENSNALTKQNELTKQKVMGVLDERTNFDGQFAL
jgi:hypothetical protein